MTCCSSEPPGAEAAEHLVRAERGAQAHAPTGNDVLLVQPAPAPLAAAAGLAAPALAVLALRAVARVSAPLSPTLAAAGVKAAGRLVHAERGAPAHAPLAPLAAAADLATPSSADLTLIENVRTAILSSSPPVPHVLVALVSVLSCPRAGQHRLGREARRLRSIREVHASSADAVRTAERGAAMPKRLSHNGYQKASPLSCQPECTSI